MIKFGGDLVGSDVSLADVILAESARARESNASVFLKFPSNVCERAIARHLWLLVDALSLLSSNIP